LNAKKLALLANSIAAERLVQTMNAIALRFQNRRLSDRDPLANPEIDPIRPLNNLMWGYIQDDQHRLTLQRRSFEYDHHYGLRRRRRRPIAGADVLSGYGKHASAIVSFHLKEPRNEQASKIIARIVLFELFGIEFCALFGIMARSLIERYG
jgi:hypothetical protein